MTSESARLALPMIETGQAQKEMTHNEALALLDVAVQAAVEAVGLDTPPVAPMTGACWIVGTLPTGAWIGHAGAIAAWTAGGWRFVGPRDGMRAWDRATGRMAVRVDGVWEDGLARCRQVLVDGQRVVTARQPAIAAPVGGPTVDIDARATLGHILATLRVHGLISDS